MENLNLANNVNIVQVRLFGAKQGLQDELYLIAIACIYQLIGSLC
jgi:hypothetical protein